MQLHSLVTVADFGTVPNSGCSIDRKYRTSGIIVRVLTSFFDISHAHYHTPYNSLIIMPLLHLDLCYWCRYCICCFGTGTMYMQDGPVRSGGQGGPGDELRESRHQVRGAALRQEAGRQGAGLRDQGQQGLPQTRVASYDVSMFVFVALKN